MHYSRRFAGFNYAAQLRSQARRFLRVWRQSLVFVERRGELIPTGLVLLACLSDTGRRLRQLIHFVTVNTEVWNCLQRTQKGMGSETVRTTERLIQHRQPSHLGPQASGTRRRIVAWHRSSWSGQRPIWRRQTSLLRAPPTPDCDVRAIKHSVRASPAPPFTALERRVGLADMHPGQTFPRSTLAHANGVDLYIAGHVHIYSRRYFQVRCSEGCPWLKCVACRRFSPLRSSPYGPNASNPNNRPADWDHGCATPLKGGGSVYTNPKYMTQVVAGSPGDIEVIGTHMDAGAVRQSRTPAPGAVSAAWPMSPSTSRLPLAGPTTAMVTCKRRTVPTCTGVGR